MSHSNHYSEIALSQLCATLELDSDFVLECITESVVLIEEVDGRLEFRDATLLRLRRVQRICLTFNVDVSAAIVMLRHVSSSASF